MTKSKKRGFSHKKKRLKKENFPEPHLPFHLHLECRLAPRLNNQLHL